MSREKHKKCSGWGNRIRELRGTLKQSEFAELLDVTWKKISDYENERSEPALTFLVDLAEHFKVTIDWIIRGETNKEQMGGSVAEGKARYGEEIAFRSEAEKATVETAVNALVQLAYSYFEYANEEQAIRLKRLLTEAELERYRRREERQGTGGVLTTGESADKFHVQGMRGLKHPDIDKLVAEALEEAGPLPSVNFKLKWDVTKKAEKAVDNWIGRHRYVVSEKDRKRLIEALALMDQRGSSKKLDPEKLLKDR